MGVPTPRVTLPAALTDDLFHAGYFPQIVTDVLDIAAGGEHIDGFLVQPETTFDQEVRRHLTVLLLTPTRLIAAHVDDHEGDEDHPAAAAATTEAVPLTAIRSVTLTHLISRPAEYVSGDAAPTPPQADPVASAPSPNLSPSHSGDGSEIHIVIGWGAASRMEVEPAFCGDQTCEADHGSVGAIVPDDLAVRVSGAADGPQAVQRAIAFARKLSLATARHG